MGFNPRRPILGGVRLALLAGYGGLLLLLLFLGVYAAQSLQRVQEMNTQSGHVFVTRNDRLQEIRSSAHLASSCVRDYLLDPDPEAAKPHLEQAHRHWAETQEALAAYARVAPGGRKGLIERLAANLESYWQAARSGLRLDREGRQKSGYSLLSEKLSPMRDQFLGTLEEIRMEDQGDLRAHISESSSLLGVLQMRLWLVIATTFLLGLGLAGVTWRHMIRLEREALARYQASVDAAEQLELLSRRLLAVQEEERRRLARELHDEVGQSVGALLVDLGQARSALPAEARETGEFLMSARRLGEATLQTLRDMCLLLRPSMLDDLGLLPALHWQARETSRRTGIDVRVVADESDELELADDVRTVVYRVVQEALQNVARHSRARTAEIVLQRQAKRLRLVIRDDGEGFDPATTRGLGLLGLQERVSELHGLFHVDSASGRGVVVSVELPLKEAQAPAAVRESRV